MKHIKYVLASTFLISTIIFYALFNQFFVVSTIAYTGSMEPYFFGGEIIINKKINDINELEIGDIASYRKGNKTIIHRVVNIDYENEMVFMLGDNNNGVDDGWIPFNKFSHKYLFTVYKGYSDYEDMKHYKSYFSN